MLSEAKTAAEQAHDLGLHHVGYGYWADDSENVVARTVDGNLIKLGNDFKGKPKNSDKDDETANEIIKNGKAALDKLAVHALEHLGKDEGNSAWLTGVKTDIKNAAKLGYAPVSSPVYEILEDDEKEGYVDFLNAIAKNKNSKLVKSIIMYTKHLAYQDQIAMDAKSVVKKKEIENALNMLQPILDYVPPKYHPEFREWLISQLEKEKLNMGTGSTLQAVKDALEPLNMFTISNARLMRQAIKAAAMGLDEIPDEWNKKQDPATAFQNLKKKIAEPESDTSGKIDVLKAANIIGLDVQHADPKILDIFTKLMQKADEAQTSVQINYIRALAKKAGILGDTEDEQWQNWKALLKYIKSVKSLKAGPMHAGKIKNKDSGHGYTYTPTPNEPQPTDKKEKWVITYDQDGNPEYEPASNYVQKSTPVPPKEPEVAPQETKPEPVTTPDFKANADQFMQAFNNFEKSSKEPTKKIPLGGATQSVAPGSIFDPNLTNKTQGSASISLPTHVDPLADLEPAKKAEIVQQANDTYLKMIDVAGMLPTDYTPTEQLQINSVIQQIMAGKKPLHAVKELEGTLTKQELQWLGTAMMGYLEPNSPDETLPNETKPDTSAAMDAIAALSIHPATSKAITTSLNGWAAKQDDPTKAVLAWVNKKNKEQPSQKWQYMALELVKNHGVSLTDVPEELIPDDIKQLMQAPATTTSAEPEETWTNELPGTFEEQGQAHDDATNIIYGVEQSGYVIHNKMEVMAAVAKAILTKNPAILEKLKAKTPADVVDALIYGVKDQLEQYTAQTPSTSTPDGKPPLKIDPFESAKDIISNLNDSHQVSWGPGLMKKVATILVDALKNQTPEILEDELGHLIPEHELEELKASVYSELEMTSPNSTPATTPTTPEPEKKEAPKPVEKVSANDTDKFLSSKLQEMEISYDNLSPEVQASLHNSVQKALSSPTEAGVYMAFKKIEKANVLPEYALSELKYEIMQELDAKGQLYKGDHAFKKTFNYTEFLDDLKSGQLDTGMVQPAERKQLADWINGLTPEQQQKLVKAMETGMNLPTSAQATAYYNEELKDLPGWDENKSQWWRRSLRYVHDEFKNAEAIETQKKAELEAKKKAEIELKKAWEMISQGDSKAAVEGIMIAAGLNSLNPTQQMAAATQIAKALNSNTTQEMFDQLDELRGHNSFGAYTPSKLTVPFQHGKFEMLRNLVSNMFFDIKNKDKETASKPEPKVNEPATERAKHVFANWNKKFGMSVGHVPDGHQAERKSLVKAVVDALAEPNPKKVNSYINTLASTTSLSDEHINQIRQLVHQERQDPQSLKGPVDYSVPKHSVPATTTPAKKPTEDIFSNDAEVKSKLKYYKVSSAQQEKVTGIMKHYAAMPISAFTKDSMSKHMKIDLMQSGMPEDAARNLANWTTLQAMKKANLHMKAVASAPTPSQVSNTPAGAVDGKATVASLAPHQDPHGFAKTEWVSGEKVLVNNTTGQVWTKHENGDTNAIKKGQEQHLWRKKNLSPELYQKFTYAANGWQGSGQWFKDPAVRKATNEAMRRAIEGPPPQYTQVEKYVERGLTVGNKDFSEFIKAFKMGEKVYIGPSGFSCNHHIATSFGGSSNNNTDSDNVKVLLRVYPDKTGKIKAARLHGRPEGSHANEEEIVVGTGKNTRVTNVIKHVNVKNGVACVSYEIEMQYEDDGINEGVEENVGGFDAHLWKGLSPNTVKMIIKYMNSSVHTNYQK